jgi:DNA-binding Lrp family transcriptional regulator
MADHFKLDRTDVRILSELQRNGRVTNVELAELVHLSPSPCLARVKRLQAEGYITSYNAHINLAKIGDLLTVFTQVTLKNHRQSDFSKFQSAISNIDRCIECHLISGGYDYLLKFVTAGIADYQDIMEMLIDRDIGIEKYFSYVVIKSPLQRHQAPVSKLFPGILT